MSTLGYRTLDAKRHQIPERPRWVDPSAPEVSVTLTIRQLAILRQALARFPYHGPDELHELADIDRALFAAAKAARTGA